MAEMQPEPELFGISEHLKKCIMRRAPVPICRLCSFTGRGRPGAVVNIASLFSIAYLLTARRPPRCKIKFHARQTEKAPVQLRRRVTASVPCLSEVLRPYAGSLRLIDRKPGQAKAGRKAGNRKRQRGRRHNRIEGQSVKRQSHGNVVSGAFAFKGGEKMATKEQIYEQLLKDMGIWDDAFRGAVHDLAVLEREQARARRAWKETAEEGEKPSMLDEHYQLIFAQGREIAKLRDSLGMTPKGLRRIITARDEAFRKSQQVADEEPEAAEAAPAESATVLDFVRARYGV